MKKKNVPQLTCLVVITPQVLNAQSASLGSVIYSIKVNRSSSVFEPWNSLRGELTLKETEITFAPNNGRNRGSFSLGMKI